MESGERAVRAWALEEGLNGTSAQWLACQKVVDLIARYGQVMNLSADLRPAALWAHVQEALIAVVALERSGGFGGYWLDLGSGGGFPGLVFAGWLDVEGALVEPRQKRFDFLRLALGALAANRRVSVYRARLENDGWAAVEGPLPPDRADWFSARAVFEPNEWLLRVHPMVGAGRVLVHGRADWRVPQGWRALASSERADRSTVWVVTKDEG